MGSGGFELGFCFGGIVGSVAGRLPPLCVYIKMHPQPPAAPERNEPAGP